MKMVATIQLRLALDSEDERSAKKMEWIGFRFDLDLIWIEIAVFKNFKECARSPCNGNHFSSMYVYSYVCKYVYIYVTNKKFELHFSGRLTFQTLAVDFSSNL